MSVPTLIATTALLRSPDQKYDLPRIRTSRSNFSYACNRRSRSAGLPLSSYLPLTEGKIGLLGAMYDLATGKVTFLEN